jgi:23S rRNA pseudouridine1911/1915/1917 synthase
VKVENRSALRVPHGEPPERIDKYVADRTSITRSQVQRLIESGLVLVNGKTVKPNYRTRAGDHIDIIIAEERGAKALAPEDIPLDILYMDDHLAVVDKPAGMVVYPAAGHARGTLLNALLFRAGKLAAVGGPLRPGVVHRLDKDTSGVMVVALDDGAYYGLAEQFRKRSIQRRYLALVYGSMKGESGRIALSIGRSETDRKKMSTKARRGKEALTAWEVAERFPGATLVSAKLATGRTHQIRVHFASIGHPVLGDRTYGKKTSIEVVDSKSKIKAAVTLSRQMLHAETLGFTHPVSGKYVEFKAPPPQDMARAIRRLRPQAI